MKLRNGKGWIRAISLLLLLATVASLCLVACSDNGDDKGKNTDQGGVTGPEGSTAAYVYEKYSEYDFDGYEFTILGMESGSWWYSSFMPSTFNEIWYDSDSSEPLESSIYKRNRLTEGLLNITISPEWAPNSEETAKKVRTALDTGETGYDIVLSDLSTSLRTAQEGFCTNLLDIETLDLNNPWWDENLTEAFTLFNDRVYVLAGDINVYDDFSIMLLLFNKDMAEERDLGSMYDYVRNNKWTIDTVAELCSKVRLTTDGVWDENDIYGSSLGGAYFHGFNLPQTETDEDGVPELTVEREEHVNAAAQLYTTIVENEYSAYGLEQNVTEEMFLNNQILIYSILSCNLNTATLRNAQTEFGVLPMPKLNEQQAKYSHFVNYAFFSTYFVPSFNQNLDRTGIILDVLGGYSTDTIYNTTFDTLMGYDSKLLRDNDSKDMLDIVMSSRQFDYSVMGLGSLNEHIYVMESWGSFMYASVVDTYKRGAKTALSKIIRGFEELA